MTRDELARIKSDAEKFQNDPDCPPALLRNLPVILQLIEEVERLWRMTVEANPTTGNPMTPAEINRAIAEWMGWTLVRPNFYGDLNACHEFEQRLTVEQSAAYGKLLDEVINSDFVNRESCLIWADWHAGAPQRCEALLRTLNLWRDNPPSKLTK